MREKEAKILENVKRRFDEIYGINAPKKFKKRFDEECEHYSKNEMSLFYEELLGKIIAKLKGMGHHSIISMTYGSTLVSYLLGVSENNPLPLHYYCPICKRVELIDKELTPWDIKSKKCDCGGMMNADGFNIPYETHLRLLEAPCAALFVGNDALEITYSIIRELLKDLSFIEEKHEGDGQKVFTILQNSGSSKNSAHLYYENPSILIIPKSSLYELRLLESKSDIKYDDVKLGEISVKGNELDFGELDGSELADVKIKSKHDLLKLCGILHGSKVWKDNGELLVMNGALSLAQLPTFREDIFNIIEPELIKNCLDRKYAQIIMRYVRTGRFALNKAPDDIMAVLASIKLPEWFIGFISSVQYMLAKSHGVQLCKHALITSYYKLNN